MYYFKAYGLCIQADVILPELLRLPRSPASVDLTIRRNSLPPIDATGWHIHPRFVSRRPQDRWAETWLHVWESADGHHTRLSYGDNVEFILDRQAQNLWVSAPLEYDISYIDSYLVNQGLGFVLRMRGITCLHASAFIANGRAVLISAPSGTGKSTFATYFASRGHQVIADDISTLLVKDNAIYVQPGYPRLRLIPETASFLLGEDNQLSMMAEGWDKLYLSLDNEHYLFAQEPVQIQAVYLLQNSSGDPEIKAISSAEAYFSLMENTYLSYLIDAPIYAADFDVIGQLLALCKVSALHRADDLARLEQTYSLVMKDLQTS